MTHSLRCRFVRQRGGDERAYSRWFRVAGLTDRPHSGQGDHGLRRGAGRTGVGFGTPLADGCQRAHRHHANGALRRRTQRRRSKRRAGPSGAAVGCATTTARAGTTRVSSGELTRPVPLRHRPCLRGAVEPLRTACDNGQARTVRHQGGARPAHTKRRYGRRWSEGRER